jgi:CubicO group peptidase (beta-lactamase class C family)
MDIMNKFIIGALLIIAVQACKRETKTAAKPSEVVINSVYSDSLTTAISDLFASGEINGLGVTVVNSDDILYQSGFGMMDLKSKKAYTPQTLQNIASISKTFIGIALMRANELGFLRLDDPVNDHLPFQLINPYFPADTITIRQLASHTSSIRDTDVYSEKAYVLKTDVPDSLTAMVEETLNPPGTKMPIADFLPMVLSSDGSYYTNDVFLNSRPGSRFEYSNIGATLAALVLENATGVPFDQFTMTHILDPLGMDSSAWSYEAIDMEQHSVLYADPDTEIPYYELITYPDGGLRSSIEDMGLYLVELIRGKKGKGRLLKPESYREYFKPVLSDSQFEERDAEFPYNDEYDMGVFIVHSGTGNIGHTGGDPGISSFMFFDPATSLGFYVIINTSIINEAGVNQLLGTVRALEEFGPKLSE